MLFRSVLDVGNRQLEEQTLSGALDKAERHARDELTRANKEKISQLLKNLRLEKRQIDRIVSKLRHCVERIEKGEEEIGQCMLRTGKPLQELRRYFRQAKHDPETMPRLAEGLGLGQDDFLEMEKQIKNGQRRIRRV